MILTREQIAKVCGKPLVEELIYGPDERKCAWTGCKEVTRWRRPRQPKHGTCPSHAIPRPADPAVEREVRLILALHFHATRVVEPYSNGEPVPMTKIRCAARDPLGRVSPFLTTVEAYPPEAGPCQNCGTFIRRGGYGGAKLCRTCQVVAA
jgi:hypothetical protein